MNDKLSIIFMGVCLVQLLTGFSFLVCMILDTIWEGEIHFRLKKLNIYIHELLYPYITPDGCLVYKVNTSLIGDYIRKCFTNKNEKKAIKSRKESVKRLYCVLKRIICIKRIRFMITIFTILFFMDTAVFWLFLGRKNTILSHILLLLFHSAHLSSFLASPLVSKVIIPSILATITIGKRLFFTEQNLYTQNLFQSIHSQKLLLQKSLFVLRNKVKVINQPRNIANKKAKRLTVNIKEAEDFLLKALHPRG